MNKAEKQATVKVIICHVALNQAAFQRARRSFEPRLQLCQVPLRTVCLHQQEHTSKNSLRLTESYSAELNFERWGHTNSMKQRHNLTWVFCSATVFLCFSKKDLAASRSVKRAFFFSFSVMNTMFYCSRIRHSIHYSLKVMEQLIYQSSRCYTASPIYSDT